MKQLLEKKQLYKNLKFKLDFCEDIHDQKFCTYLVNCQNNSMFQGFGSSQSWANSSMSRRTKDHFTEVVYESVRLHKVNFRFIFSQEGYQIFIRWS